MEDWAEIRRLHQAEGMPIKVIARRLGVARNTVRAALASDRPPQYQRPPRGSVVDPFEPQIRALLQSWPTMPAPAIAERIGWPYSLSPLKKRLALLRPEYKGIDPADRVSYEPGKIAQCDLWFPDVRIPVGPGQERVLPVLVMVLGFSRLISAVMLPSRQGGDLLAGMWQVIEGWGRVPKSLVWDREAAIGGTGKPPSRSPGSPAPSRPGSSWLQRVIRSSRASSSGRTSTWKPRSCPAGYSPAQPISTPRLPSGSPRPRTADWCGRPAPDRRRPSPPISRR